MSELTTLMDRNQQFAEQYGGKLNILPRLFTVVLTCTDARVDPAHYLGLELGDALVIRNGGARVSSARREDEARGADAGYPLLQVRGSRGRHRRHFPPCNESQGQLGLRVG